MKNKRFIVLLIALIALIALIFAVGFLAGRNNNPMDHSVLLPTQWTQTEESTICPEPTTPDSTSRPDDTADPHETGLPKSTLSVSDTPGTNTLSPEPKNTPKPTFIPHTSPVYDKAFTLTILGTYVPVSIGVSNETLDKTPGWLETSAYPGDEGVCIIYGHRNRNHLQVLKDIDFGDTITVTLADGTVLNYTVESIRILEPDEELHVPFISGQHIMLTTCYPFYYTGHAPQKFVLIASFQS